MLSPVFAYVQFFTLFFLSIFLFSATLYEKTHISSVSKRHERRGEEREFESMHRIDKLEISFPRNENFSLQRLHKIISTWKANLSDRFISSQLRRDLFQFRKNVKNKLDCSRKERRHDRTFE